MRKNQLTIHFYLYAKLCNSKKNINRYPLSTQLNRKKKQEIKGTPQNKQKQRPKTQ